MFSSWRDTEDIHAEVERIRKELGWNYTNVMKGLLRLGIDAHGKPVKAKEVSTAASVPDNTKVVLAYLNEVTGRKFSVSNELTARLKEVTIEEIKLVIDYKSKEWMGTKDQKYLRPETLFRKSKFEGYLNDANQNVIHAADYQPNQKRTHTNELERQAREALENINSAVPENGGFVLEQVDIEHKFE